jgi:regulator of protease activity HflC (stomatin/prohibitin superfamily)
MSAHPVTRPAAWLLVGFFSLLAAGTAVFARQTGLNLFAALACLTTWATLAATASLVPRLPFRLRETVLVLLATGIAATTVRFALPRALAPGGATDLTLQAAAVLLSVAAFALHFLATYATHLKRETPDATLTIATPFARLLAAAFALVVVALLSRLYLRRNLFGPVESVLLVTTLVLAAETFLAFILRLYQPARLRAASALGFGQSLLLPALFGEAGPLRSLAATLEKAFGVNLADAWLLRLARALAAPLLLLFALGLWASTAVTRVPVDSRGVLILRGEFQPAALAPGLHLHAPWPWARVALVATERVQEIALGYERDLAGPVLWAEKHFEGEQNLLVGRGEELLTFNVPIHYRIRDAVAFLRHTSDPRAALATLGYRELLTLAGTHTAFGLMTTDREAIAAALHTRLQAAADRLALGLELTFVGLKDVHPPVAVAPAYQDVISAEEERSAVVDQARTYAVDTLAAARVTATTNRLAATALATARRARATGESARFLAPLPTYRAHPGVFQTRVRLETLEAALADLRALYVVPAGARHLYLGTDTFPPTGR